MKYLLILATLISSTAIPADVVPGIEAQVGLPPGLLGAISQVESGGNPNAVHKNDGKGDSLGLFQIKLSTARMVGFRGTKKQLMNVKTNAYFAAKYLKKQIQRYHGNYAQAVTAYNSGTTHSNGGSLYMAKVFNAWAASQ
jgi:soluble lytic murein transglycosylase-like protein